MSYKIISFDIFQTLADVNRRIPEIWRGILKDGYTEEKAAQGSKAVLGALHVVFEDAVQAERFRTMADVFLECAERGARELSFAVSPQEVAHHLTLQHARAPFYREVLDCMKRLRKGHGIILSSDSSHPMVDDLISGLDYDIAFISDDLESYKGGPDGKFFQTVLARLGADPGDVIHIGDSASDVLGAHRAGIASCWLNRDGRQWTRGIRPDFIVRDFNELETIL